MRLIFILSWLVLFSCSKKTAVPEGVLPMPEMTEILWDLMVADEMANYRYPSDLIARTDSAMAMYRQITAAHGTTKEQLQKSLRFYEGRPDLLQVIFDTLHQRSTAPLPQKKDSAAVK